MSEAGETNRHGNHDVPPGVDPASLIKVYPAHAKFTVVKFLAERDSYFGTGHSSIDEIPCLVWIPRDLTK